MEPIDIILIIAVIGCYAITWLNAHRIHNRVDNLWDCHQGTTNKLYQEIDGVSDQLDREHAYIVALRDYVRRNETQPSGILAFERHHHKSWTGGDLNA